MKYNTGKNYSFRKGIVYNTIACLYIKILATRNGKTVETDGLACACPLEKGDLEEMKESVIQVAKFRAISKLNGNETSDIYEKMLTEKLDFQVLDVQLRYLTKDRVVKTFNRKGKKFTSVRDKKTGRFISYNKFESVKDIF